MKQFNRQKGGEGEEIAAKYLRKRGYQILEQNYSVKFGEIDLVVSQNNILIFVEVKLKTTDDFGTPEEMIGKAKLSQVERMAQLYLMQNPQIEEMFDSFRIDAVCIVGSKNNVERIKHYENVTF